jgi:hypothetical protein
MLSEIARNMKAHGFKNIISSVTVKANPTGMATVAAALTAQGRAISHRPRSEQYTYNVVSDFMEQQGLVVPTRSDNLHDDPIITLNMYATDPESISWSRRMAAGLPTINGFDLTDPIKTRELAAKVVDFRANYTIEGIKKAIAYGGTVPVATAGRGAGAGGNAPAAGRAGGPGGL